MRFLGLGSNLKQRWMNPVYFMPIVFLGQIIQFDLIAYRRIIWFHVLLKLKQLLHQQGQASIQ